MTTRLAALAILGTLLSACAEGEVPIYLGDERIGTLPGTGTPTVAAAGTGGASECQALALRAADPTITDAQRRAAAEYRASLGC